MQYRVKDLRAAKTTLNRPSEPRETPDLAISPVPTALVLRRAGTHSETVTVGQTHERRLISQTGVLVGPCP